MQRLPQNKFKVLDYTTVCFYLSCLDNHSWRYRRQNYIENDLKGRENCFELGGLELRRI